VGKAMGSGIDAAVESVDMVLLSAASAACSRRCPYRARPWPTFSENLFWAFAFNAIAFRGGGACCTPLAVRP
jgi:cation transport ATPase